MLTSSTVHWHSMELELDGKKYRIRVLETPQGKAIEIQSPDKLEIVDKSMTDNWLVIQ